MFGEMVSVVKNELDGPSSDPVRGCLHFIKP